MLRSQAQNLVDLVLRITSVVCNAQRVKPYFNKHSITFDVNVEWLTTIRTEEDKGIGSVN